MVAFTLALYSPVRNHDFVNFDDDVYVSNNLHVTGGLGWQTVGWALTSNEQANWHPLTWLSHALDCQLFGLDAGYHHLTNLVIHALNVLLLFLLLRRATGALGPSFVVAGLFAWHPFNVESVAWIAERKNVLSTFFLLLAIGAYGWHTRRPQFKRLGIVAGAFALALASKPMVVTLPFALLLLDYWPLRRVAGWTEMSPHFPVPQQPVSRLLLEKLPLLALSAASSAVTVWAQKSGGAVRSLQLFPLRARLGNALYSYAVYLQKTFWPSGFAVLYPHPGTSLPLWKPALALLLLSAISATVWKQRTARPYLLVGWLWFVGTLVPVIGLVQVGEQAMADRYAYVPLIGLFVMVVWGAAEFLEVRQVASAAVQALGVTALGILSMLSLRQLSYWQDSVSLWSHTLQITSDNLTAERGIAKALDVRGDSDEAVRHYLNVVRLDPKDLSGWVNIGAYYAAHGRLQEASQEFQTAIKLSDQQNLSPDDLRYRASAQLDLGFAYVLSRDYPSAQISFEGAYRSDPAMADQILANLDHSLTDTPSEGGYIKVALLLLAKGKDTEALTILRNAIQANPGYTETEGLLAYLSMNRK